MGSCDGRTFLTAILGISAFYHDSAAALVVDGRIVAAAQEERFSRVKHDARFPREATAWCLAEAGITPASLDGVVFYEKPLLKFERILETHLAFAPRGWRSFINAMPVWLKRKLFLPREIDRELRNEYEGPIWFANHHESHAASAFYPSPFEESAILTVDGVGEWTTLSWGRGEGNRVRLQKELRFPHSLGLLYSAFTYYAGFRVNSGEYKLMGLAPYGEPAYADVIFEKLIDLKDDGSFRLDMSYFNYAHGFTMTSGKFHRLFGGPPRRPEARIEQRHMDLAASVQKVAEEILMRIVSHVHAETGLDRLCLAGGVALNCVANGRILREGPFKELWIQPASGDAGGALGAALLGWHRILGKPREVQTPDGADGSFLGPSFDRETVRKELDALGAKVRFIEDEDALLRETASLLACGKVVGFVSGRMEFGPRALGARSILGDARDPGLQSALNRKIKFRESFRPFAPSCLEDRAGEYFEIDRPSPYMLLVAPVKRERLKPLSEEDKSRRGLDRLKAVRSDVPAVTHVDGSARIQTVNPGQAPRFHRLLKAFEERTGCGLLVNTSFNIRGEPIVCSPSDAYRCFMFTDMDALVVENALCLKEDQPPLEGEAEYRKRFRSD